MLSKTGPAQCNPGTNCTFALTIANTSGLPFAGPVQISDSMFVGGAPVVESSVTIPLARLCVAWAVVVIPLSWGVVETVRKAAGLFP